MLFVISRHFTRCKICLCGMILWKGWFGILCWYFLQNIPFRNSKSPSYRFRKLLICSCVISRLQQNTLVVQLIILLVSDTLTIMITQLPVVILLKILSYLSVDDLTKTALVSKQFLGLCKLILSPRNGLLDLSSTWQTPVENKAVIPSNALQAARVFEKVSLRYCTKHSFRFLLNFRALRVLDLFGTNIRDHELLALSKRFHFLAVDLGFCKELTSHGLCSFFEEQTCLRAIGLASGGSPWITFHAVNNEVSIFSGG